MVVGYKGSNGNTEDGPAKGVAFENCALGQEEVAGIQGVVAEKLKQAAVIRVSSRLDDLVHDSA